MNLLLPVDSRVSDTQGFLILNTESGDLRAYPTDETLPYVRQGFRGACAIGRTLYVTTRIEPDPRQGRGRMR